MSRESIFCVQTYKKLGHQLQKAVLMQFTSASEAEEVGQALSAKFPAVVVYALHGDPAADVWDDPELFAAHGERVAA